MAKEINGYELSRAWFDWCFENPEKINTNHSALYFFCIEQCNRLGWKEKFGLPTTMAKDAIGIRSYNTYIKTLRDLCEFGFITMIEISKNQYSSNIITLSKFNKALNNTPDKALDKALIKHVTKHRRKQHESTGESIDSIDKQVNNKTKEPLTIEPTNNNDLPDGSYKKFVQIYSDWYEKRVGVKILFDGIQGKAIKKIIQYLIDNSKEKNSQGGADAWEYILQNWDKIDKFYQDQVKVNQIQSNLPNILNQLKNGNSKNQPTNNQSNIHNTIDSMFTDPTTK